MRINRFRKKKKVSKFQKLRQWPWKRLILFGFIGTVIALIIYSTFFLPSVKNAAELSFAESTIIYDRGALEVGAKPEEHILYVIHGDENREYIPLEEISPWVKKATIAIEDDQFYSHFGFDLPALVKVFLHEAFGVGRKRGGSTITQQLAKQVFLSSERSYTRKFKELLLAMKLEWHYSKDEILELYLNKIPYGNNAFGIEAAARTYFGKSSRDLTLTEASILASIPVAPTRFNPYGTNRDLLMGYYDYKEYYRTEAEARAEEEKEEPLALEDPDEDTEESTEEKDENANKLRVYKKGRKDLVIQRMLELEYISQEEFQQAWGEGLYAEFNRAKSDIKAPHFVFYVREQLEEKYGKEFLDQGGLRIYTTLDPDLQNIAEESIETKSKNYDTAYGANNVAMTSINPENGEILAYVGGKNFFDEANDGQVDVLASRRQPGSSFKPVVFAAGFEDGLYPSSVTFDVETQFSNSYRPRNFDEKYQGPVSFRRALNASLNIPAIKMAYLATPKKVLETADKMGIKYEGDADTHGIAIGVGVAEVEPLSHINAYQTFARDGSYYEPISILEIQNADGKLLEKVDNQDFKKEGISSESAALVRSILTDESTRPTTDGFNWNKLMQLKDLDNGAKTGTSNRVIKNPAFNSEIPESNSNRKFLTVPGDSWTIGFTPHLVSGVWVGNNRGKPMKSGSTGMTVAAPIWKDFMTKAHEQLVKNGADIDKEYPESVELVTKTVNRLNGKLATEQTPESLQVNAIFPPSNLPTKLDDSITEKTINILTGEDATEKTPVVFTKKTQALELTSARPDLANWQAPIDEWIADHPEFILTLGEELNQEDTDEDEDKNQWKIPDEFIQDLPPFLQQRIRELQSSDNEIDWSKLEEPDSISAPKVKIVTPRNQITTGKIEVTVQAQSKAPIEMVEYYLDDKLIYQAKKRPFTGKFSIPETFNFGSRHKLKAVLIDQRFGIAEDEISVTVGEDKTGPNIVVLGPFANQEIPINSEAQIQVQATDTQSSVEKVEFLVNNKSLGISTQPPFSRTFFVKERGRKTIKIKAWDGQGNMSQKTIPINVVREKIIENKSPFISDVNQRFRTVFIETIFPAPEEIVKAKLIVSQPEKILFESEWNKITKYKQTFIPKEEPKGTATAALYIQKIGEDELKKVSQRTINF